jgi:hypothetical protein
VLAGDRAGRQRQEQRPESNRTHRWHALGQADEHAKDFVAGIDPDGQWLTVAAQPIGEVIEINHNGVTLRRRVLKGRVVDWPDARDGWSNRGTFSGDTEAFLAAENPGSFTDPGENRREREKERERRTDCLLEGNGFELTVPPRRNPVRAPLVSTHGSPARRGTNPERDEKFESGFLQRRVCEPSVPQRRSQIADKVGSIRRRARRRCSV